MNRNGWGNCSCCGVWHYRRDGLCEKCRKYVDDTGVMCRHPEVQP